MPNRAVFWEHFEKVENNRKQYAKKAKWKLFNLFVQTECIDQCLKSDVNPLFPMTEYVLEITWFRHFTSESFNGFMLI